MSTSNETPLIEARNVTKVFGGGLFDKTRTLAVDNISMVIDARSPSITALVGESGSGKTTLARLLLGRIAPTEGVMLYKGRDLEKLSRGDKKTFLRDVQVIFQDPDGVYNPFYKVDHVLTTPIAKFKLAGSKEERQELMENMLREVGMRPEEVLGRHPHQLSGGQRQRIMVARTLLLKPSLILADEPVSMIDASLRATVLKSLRQLNEDFGISLLYITHDLATAYQISENIMVMYLGSVTEVGDVERVIQDPLHPYTQLLVSSIPQAIAERKWGGGEIASTSLAQQVEQKGCKFANRCPEAMPKCAEEVPPLYRTDPHRAAACFLYEDAPALESHEMMEVFAPAASSRDAGELS
jgi:oligopeptide/dipeptide ABC transporter ATP-binding protein